MRTDCRMLKRITKLGLFLMGVSMNAEAGLFGFGGTSWKEEVLLHDGDKIVVDRSVERGDGGARRVNAPDTEKVAQKIYAIERVAGRAYTTVAGVRFNAKVQAANSTDRRAAA